MEIFKRDSLVCSIEIGYEINTRAKKGRFYYDPNAPNDHDRTSDETIEEFLKKFYVDGIRIERIAVRQRCSLEAEWSLDEYNNGKISISKSE